MSRAVLLVLGVLIAGLVTAASVMPASAAVTDSGGDSSSSTSGSSGSANGDATTTDSTTGSSTDTSSTTTTTTTGGTTDGSATTSATGSTTDTTTGAATTTTTGGTTVVLPTVPQLCDAPDIADVNHLLERVPATSSLVDALDPLAQFVDVDAGVVKLKAGVKLDAVRVALGCDATTTTALQPPVDCGHLSQAQAQAILEQDQAHDPHHLDPDGDGRACHAYEGSMGGQIRHIPVGGVQTGDGSTLR